jgi:hypothetical protein
MIRRKGKGELQEGFHRSVFDIPDLVCQLPD